MTGTDTGTETRTPNLAVPSSVFAEKVTLEDIEAAVDPWPTWAHECHAVSLAIVKSGLLAAPARVARGSALGVPGQHSWIVLGDDCYDPHAQILDPTLWSYDDAQSPLLLRTSAAAGIHHPHGAGNIFDYGKPSSHGGEPIELDRTGLGARAKFFLDLIGPLDRQGWSELVHAPVGNWPAKEILTAAYQDNRLSALIPIDIIGMATDLNPEGLYR